jgi:hypothetical protein
LEDSERISFDAVSETAPLITKGCSFDRKTGTIIIDTKQLMIILDSAGSKIDQSEIKKLEMK